MRYDLGRERFSMNSWQFDKLIDKEDLIHHNYTTQIFIWILDETDYPYTLKIEKVVNSEPDSRAKKKVNYIGATG